MSVFNVIHLTEQSARMSSLVQNNSVPILMSMN